MRFGCGCDRPASRKARTVAARRGVWLVLALIVVASLLSAAGVWFTASFAGRRASVPASTALVLRLDGDLGEVEGSGLFDRFVEGPPTVRALIDAIGRAKTDKRVKGLVLEPVGGAPFWARSQEIRDAILDFRKSGKKTIAYPRVRRRAGVLPRHGLREDRAAAVERPRPEGPGDLRGVPARRLRQDRRDAGLRPHRRLQDGDQRLHAADLHPGAPRDDGVAQPRHVRSAGAGDRGGPQEDARDGAGADRRGPVPRRGRARGRAGGRPRSTATRSKGRSGSATRTRPTSPTTCAPCRRPSASARGRRSR